MKTLTKFMALCRNPNMLLKRLLSLRVFRILPDKLFIRWQYRLYIGRSVNLKNPKAFNEKIQWLKLYNKKKIFITLVDKFEVRDFIKKKIGEQYLIPLIGVWDTYDEIDLNALPEQFVMKCTHDSGGLVICKNKSLLDHLKMEEKIKACLAKNYFWVGREWPYKHVKPRIIVEKYMADKIDGVNSESLLDYKFMCFHGKVRCIFTCTDRDTQLKVTFFTRNWSKLPFERHYPRDEKEIKPPVNLKKMIELSEKICEEIAFARIDFYEISGEIYFGEITLYPGCGLEEFSPPKWDYVLGSWLNLEQA